MNDGSHPVATVIAQYSYIASAIIVIALLHLKPFIGSFQDVKDAFGFPTMTVAGVLIHHTAVGDVPEGALNVDRLDRSHNALGFGRLCGGVPYHIGYHYLILQDGRVQEGRPEGCRGAHAGSVDSNRLYLGVALVGNFASSAPRREDVLGHSGPSEEQLDSLIRLLSRLTAKYHLDPDSILAHSEVRHATLCPGNLMPMSLIRTKVRQLTGPPSWSPAELR